jgi:hypothetical protein
MDIPDAHLFYQAAVSCLLVIFAGFDMLRNRTVECQRESLQVPAASLHKQLTLRCDQENVNTSMLKAAAMYEGSHFLTDDYIIVIYDIEQFVGHTGSSNIKRTKDAKIYLCVL